MAGAEDAEHKVGVHGGGRDPELVQGSLHVEVALHDVRDVVHRHKVVVLQWRWQILSVSPSAAINGGTWRGLEAVNSLYLEDVCVNAFEK